MKQFTAPCSSGRLAIGTLAAALALSFAASSFGAQTDIANTPIISTTPAQVKPNIMLLMDASGSMGRTHMPDEVETQTGPTSVGYKNWQCNALYYNPAQTYKLPVDSRGINFPTPSFSAAPYAGFAGSYYTAPTVTELSSVDLRSQFVPYDEFTLDQTAAVAPVPQAAYYYLYSGPQGLNFAGAPCTDAEQSGASQAATGSGGGTWTRVIVSNTSGPGNIDERQNFANWYSFYRTRLGLIKSAASLAFAPLSVDRRVGFITVSPKDTPTSSTINTARYLPIKDFDTTQKDDWFKKLFSQVPGGASPAREGLARVGRYYAGKEDSINSGMPATGVNDPVQYSCQQNFTIMTTDGYWNAQTETPTGGGLYGGPLALDGITKVGQQDGDPTCPLSNPYCPRPIWDGVSGSTRTSTDKINAYSSANCQLSNQLLKSTSQITKATSVLQKDSTRTSRRTLQYLETKQQEVATTTQTSKSVDQTTQTTRQFVESTAQVSEIKSQVYKSVNQTTKVTEQYQLQKIQSRAQTKQTTKKVEQTTKHTEQWKTATEQYTLTTTQYTSKTTQFQFGKTQIEKYQYQIIAYDTAAERGTAVSGNCVPSGSIECRTYVVFAKKPVDPSACTVQVGTVDVGPGPGYVRTECTNGSQAVPTQPVASCSPLGTTTSGSPNYVTSTCAEVTTSPEAAFSGTCTVGTTQGAAPNYLNTTCSRPSSNNVANQPVTSCTLGTTSSGAPNYITTTCSKPAGPNNQAATNSPECTVGSTTNQTTLVTTTCTKPTDTTAYSAPCTDNPGTSAPYTKTTCTLATLSPMPPPPVDPASCTSGSTGAPNYVVTTCTTTNVAPNASLTPVESCTPGVGPAPDYIQTTCNYTGSNNTTSFVASCTVGTTAGTMSNNWVTTTCSKPSGANNATSKSPPGSCVSNPGTTSPFLKVSCTSNQTMAPTLVDPATCTPIGSTVGPAPDYYVTTCDKRTISSTAVAACTPSVGPAPNYVVTECGNVGNSQPVAACTPGTTNSGPPNYQTVTCSNPPGPTNQTQYVAFGTCSPQAPAVGNSYVERTCTNAPISGPTVVDPATCTSGSGSAPDYFHTTCSASPAGPFATPTGVASCGAGTGPGPNFYTTTCTNPVATNYASKPVSSCTPGSSIDSNQVTTTCALSDVTVFVVGSTCTNQMPTSGNGYKTISCATAAAATNEPTASCTVGQSLSTSPFDTTTACNTAQLTASADAPSCTANVGPGPGYVRTTCGMRPLTSNTPDSACAAGTDANGVVTLCSTVSGGSGYKYFVSTTTTTTTTPYSGTVATGPGTTTTSTTAATAVDNACYGSMQTIPSPTFPLRPAPPAGCTAWPCETTAVGAGGSKNSLADVAQYYYKTPLRTGSTWLNNVPAIGSGPEDDNAPHIHMTTFVVGLGVSGTLEYRQDYRSTSVTTGDFADVRTGAKSWPVWPNPAIDPAKCFFGGPNPSDCPMYDDPKSIDDFWHTAVNGRGTYFSAKNPTSVVLGLGDALAGIAKRVASGSADGASTLEPVAGNNFVYAANYQTGSWQGDLEAFEINLSTGALNTPRLWSAKTLLDAKTSGACDNRNIYLVRPGAANNLVEFAWNTDKCPSGTPSGTLTTTLNAAEQAVFANVSNLGQYGFMSDGTAGTVDQRGAISAPNGFKLVNFLRGQRQYEGYEYDSLTKLFRARASVLGDIVDSQPVYVQKPFASYQDPGYDAFVAAKASRTPMVYVGANDGMLHAFYAGTYVAPPGAPDPLAGQEKWAIIPSAVLPKLYTLASSFYDSNHEFFVDGTPVVGDVYDSAASAWRTVLVTGLNAGGKGYFAVDVTDPTAAPKVLWEFKADPAACPVTSAGAVGNTSDCNLGFTFGKPVITKLAGTWVVMLTSGYNNVNTASNGGDGGGYLYVLNAMTGAIIHKIATGAGDAATPSGLAQINNFVDNVPVNNSTLRVYGGDVLGNVWRFEFAPAATAQLLGTAKDASSNPQPITARPELAELNGKPIVFVGTGKLLGASDVADTAQQSIYGISDPLTSGPVYANLRGSLRPITMTQVGSGAAAVRTVACTGAAADCARTAGWVVDLAEAGERVNVDMKLVLGTLIVGTNVPEPVACSVGGHSWFNYFDFRTGLAVPGAPYSNPLDPTSPRIVSSYLSDSLIVGFNVYKLPPVAGQSNGRFIAGFHLGDSTHVEGNPAIADQPPQGRRISWREIPQ